MIFSRASSEKALVGVATRCIAGCREAEAPRAAVRNKIYFNLKMRCKVKLGWRTASPKTNQRAKQRIASKGFLRPFDVQFLFVAEPIELRASAQL